MKNDHLQEPRALLASRLDELWRAAGSPPLDAVARAVLTGRAQSTGKLTGKKISAWKTGANVPQSFSDLGGVVHVLIERARQARISDTSPGLLQERQWRSWWTEARTSSPLHQGPKRSVLGQVIDEGLDPFDLEVHRAIDDEDSGSISALPIYIEREHDRRLRDAVEHAKSQSTLVVLVGGSSTGKTRSCWEAVRQLKGWSLWHPVSPSRPEALLDALDKGIIMSRTVLWLNEMQYYLKDAELGFSERIAAGLRELLRDHSHTPVLVLGTLWPEYWDTFTRRPSIGEPDKYAQCRELLAGHKIQVPDTFEETNTNTLSDAARTDERVMRALSRPDKRITQFLAGAFELQSRYESAPAAPHALINVAIDTSRFGIGSTLPESLLRNAVPGYLTDYEWNDLGDDWLTNALEYTSQPCLGISGPLARIRPRSSNRSSEEPLYKLADFLEDTGRTSRKFSMPPETFWDAIANQADSPDVLINIAYELHHRGRYRNAARVYLMAANAGEINGLLYLADARRRAGDNTDAESLLEIAADRGSLAAYIDLAELQHEAGETESAKQILKNVLIDHPIDSEDRSFAWKKLADLCEDAGDMTTARRWLKQAASEGDRSAAHVLARPDRRGNNIETMTELIKASTLLLRTYRAIERLHRHMIRLSCASAEGFTAALQYYEETAANEKKTGKKVDALLMLGRVHAAHGNYAAAEAIFLRAINALADDYVKGVIPALVELVKLSKKTGDDNAAKRLWKYGLELDGSISAPWKALDQLPGV